MKNYIDKYRVNLISALDLPDINKVPLLAMLIKQAWQSGNKIYLCGNGGSAGNAIHIANDFIYGAGKSSGKGISVEALSANPAVLTCLANDIGFDDIYSEQIKVKGNADDLLIVFSGSGNSTNVIKALNVANEIGMNTVAILGFSGGECKKIAKLPLHFEVNDMQISEDLQLIICHMCMQWLADQNIHN